MRLDRLGPHLVDLRCPNILHPGAPGTGHCYCDTVAGTGGISPGPFADSGARKEVRMSRKGGAAIGGEAAREHGCG